jgi:hypothetical protein
VAAPVRKGRTRPIGRLRPCIRPTTRRFRFASAPVYPRGCA